MKKLFRHILSLLIFALMIDLNSAMEIKSKWPKEKASCIWFRPAAKASTSGNIIEEETPAPASPSTGPASIMLDDSGARVLKVKLGKDQAHRLDAELFEELEIYYRWPKDGQLAKLLTFVSETFLHRILTALKCMKAFVD
ncbi:hypothetical protein PSHT_08977 [Puccinia striiformis]|uniref:Uncharacterized protein n=1 Tax=Puccinia striiformis TaxID=27350 RepID=A0A2S4VKH7_9BASI|nr:hypothetical protein PSHT_08977 [Puccinia striiformis]